MTILDFILLVKIIGTALLVALPLLLLSAQRIAMTLSIGEEAIPYLRLYGVAILALLVGYSFGFSPLISGNFPWGIVCMGIVSNGLGALTLLLTGASRSNKASTVLISLIAIALVFSALRPDMAMSPLL